MMNVEKAAHRDNFMYSSYPKRTQGLPWWQRCLVQQAAKSAQKELDKTIRGSPFLQRPESSDIPTFSRSEIATGKALGKGGYSVVLEITGFELDDRISEQMAPDAQAARENLCHSPRLKNGECRFVVKHLHASLIHDKESFTLACADLAKEAEYLKRLDHPNIIKIHGMAMDGLGALSGGHHDGFFIILERVYCTLGERVEQWKSENRQEEAEGTADKIELSLHLARALGYLHKHRIIFRDLKPQNIGFDENNGLRLFDFGLCRELPTGQANDTYTMSGVGTRRYLAPEVFSREYNEKADIYGWALICWQMFSLEKPFAVHDSHMHRILVCRHGERPEMENTKVPLSLQSVIASCWAQDPGLRLSCSDLVKNLVDEARPKCQVRKLVVIHTEEGIECAPDSQPYIQQGSSQHTLACSLDFSTTSSISTMDTVPTTAE